LVVAFEFFAVNDRVAGTDLAVADIQKLYICFGLFFSC
jgi:hypothetical protein